MSVSGVSSIIELDLERGINGVLPPQRFNSVDSRNGRPPSLTRSLPVRHSQLTLKKSINGSVISLPETGSALRFENSSEEEQPLTQQSRVVQKELQTRLARASTFRPPFVPKQEAIYELQDENLSRAPTNRRLRSRSVDVPTGFKQFENWQESVSTSTCTPSPSFHEKQKPLPDTFPRRVFEAGEPGLVHGVCDKELFKNRRSTVLDLTTLAKMHQHVLARRLVDKVKTLKERGAWVEIGIGQTLHAYCEAVRDLEHMERSSASFMVSTLKPLDAKLLEDAGLANSDPNILQLESLARFTSAKAQTSSAAQVRRLFMAMLGGMTLLGPFLIMALVSGYVVRVLATCLFTLAFGIAIALGSDLSPEQLTLTTAAYAAALVIFAGAQASR